MAKTLMNPISAAMRCALGMVLLASAGVALAGDIHFKLESPVAGMPFSGISNLRGYAFSSVGMDRVELYVDGVYHSELPMGGLRDDVAAYFPEYAAYPDMNLSGFSIAYNYGNMTAGPHQMSFRGVDNDGAEQSVLVSFDVVKFNQSFVSDPSSVNYSQATFTGSGNDIYVTGMRVGGVAYNAVLTWQTESQQFQFTDIVPTGG